MDYDADGTLDFISGSYDPGDLYFFRGLGGGKYAKVIKILDENGTPLVHHPKELEKYERMRKDPDSDDDEEIQARVASFGSWASPVDWDADGDLDILIGSFGGKLYRRMNIGTRSEPVYSAESIPVKAGGRIFQIGGHTDPVPVDWNGDGLWDLVVGSSDGSVGWYENLGTANEPKLGPRRDLVESKSDSKFLTQYLEPGEDAKPGVRAQICVADYNRDGHLDLLVGDYSNFAELRTLEPSEREDLDELLLAESEVIARMYREPGFSETDSFKEEMKAIAAEKKLFLAKGDDDERRIVSHVWLYLRSPNAASESPAADGTPDPQPADEETVESGPVALRANLNTVLAGTGAKVTLTVELEIDPGWHVYASVPAGDPAPPTTVTLDLPDGVRTKGEWQHPEGRPALEDPRKRVYEGRVSFIRQLEVFETAAAGSLEIEVEVAYQVCNARFCLPPDTLRLTLVLGTVGGD